MFRYLTILFSTLFVDGFSQSIDDLIPYNLDLTAEIQLTVIYNNKELTPGDLVTPYEMRNVPKVVWTARPGYYYHLLMFDGDAPSRTNHSLNDIKHWLLVNIPETDLERGETIAEYGGGLPQHNTGVHRYVFLLFATAELMVCDEPKSVKNSLQNRYNFNVWEFCERYGLETVYAANYLTSEWEPYVDEYMKNVTL